MAKVIVSPEVEERPWNHPGIFLAGGISNCDDWQAKVAERFARELPDNVVIINPRRVGTIDPTHEPTAREQITWEFEGLRDASVVVFWFPAGGPNPIALFELGKEMVKALTNTKYQTLFIGCDPGNARALDITIQTELMGYEYTIFQDLDSLMDSVIEMFED